MTTPERAALLIRELLQTPRGELVHFPTRMGLRTQPTQEDLESAYEVLVALVTALESDRGPAWQRIHDAWVGLRQRVTAVPLPGSLSPAAPAWLGTLPAMPALGDPAPGTAAAVEQARQHARFVPVAPPGSALRPIIEPEPPMSLSATPPTPPLSPLRAFLADNVPTIGAGAPWQTNAGSPSPTPLAVYGESYATGPRPAGHPGYPPAPESGAVRPPATPFGTNAAPVMGFVSPSPRPQGLSPPRSPLPPPVRPAMPSSPDLTLWTTSRYAALCAACSAAPSRARETQQEYGLIDDHTRRQLDDHFAELFDREPAEQEQWERLVVQFRERIRPQ